MDKKEFYNGIVITYVIKGEIRLGAWVLRRGESHSDVKYIYGKIVLNVGPGTVGTSLSCFEFELEKTKEDMYIRFFDEYCGEVADVQHWGEQKEEEGEKDGETND